VACSNEKGLDSRHGRANVLLVLDLLLVLTVANIQHFCIFSNKAEVQEVYSRLWIARAGLPARLLVVC
jgi:hypothetical protein